MNEQRVPDSQKTHPVVDLDVLKTGLDPRQQMFLEEYYRRREIGRLGGIRSAEIAGTEEMRERARKSGRLLAERYGREWFSYISSLANKKWSKLRRIRWRLKCIEWAANPENRAFLTQIGARGGQTTFKKYGSDYMRMLQRIQAQSRREKKAKTQAKLQREREERKQLWEQTREAREAAARERKRFTDHQAYLRRKAKQRILRASTTGSLGRRSKGLKRGPAKSAGTPEPSSQPAP